MNQIYLFSGKKPSKKETPAPLLVLIEKSVDKPDPSVYGSTSSLAHRKPSPISFKAPDVDPADMQVTISNETANEGLNKRKINTVQVTDREEDELEIEIEDPPEESSDAEESEEELNHPDSGSEASESSQCAALAYKRSPTNEGSKDSMSSEFQYPKRKKIADRLGPRQPPPTKVTDRLGPPPPPPVYDQGQFERETRVRGEKSLRRPSKTVHHDTFTGDILVNIDPQTRNYVQDPHPLMQHGTDPKGEVYFPLPNRFWTYDPQIADEVWNQFGDDPTVFSPFDHLQLWDVINGGELIRAEYPEVKSSAKEEDRKANKTPAHDSHPPSPSLAALDKIKSRQAVYEKRLADLRDEQQLLENLKMEDTKPPAEEKPSNSKSTDPTYAAVLNKPKWRPEDSIARGITKREWWKTPSNHGMGAEDPYRLGGPPASGRSKPKSPTPVLTASLPCPQGFSRAELMGFGGSQARRKTPPEPTYRMATTRPFQMRYFKFMKWDVSQYTVEFGQFPHAMVSPFLGFQGSDHKKLMTASSATISFVDLDQAPRSRTSITLRIFGQTEDMVHAGVLACYYRLMNLAVDPYQTSAENEQEAQRCLRTMIRFITAVSDRQIQPGLSRLSALTWT